MDDYPRVAIIVLNWNGWQDTLECLESLYRIDYKNFDVILVDNNSQDESLRYIMQYAKGQLTVESPFFQYDPHNKPITIIDYTREEVEYGYGEEAQVAHHPSERGLVLIKNERNYGFAGGNNIAIRYALGALRPDYVLLLNNDTVVDVDFLSTLVEYAESEVYIGIAGPKIYYYEFDGKRDVVQSCGSKTDLYRGLFKHYGYREHDSGLYNNIREVDYVSGSCILIKRTTIESIGLLDTDYFCYFEETDYCVRARNNGYRVFCVPHSIIWHKGFAAAKKIPGFELYQMTRNMLWFERKYTGRWQFCFFLAYFIAFQCPKTTIKLIFTSNWLMIRSYFRGIRHGLLGMLTL